MKPQHLVPIVIITLLLLTGCEADHDFTLIERQIKLQDGSTVTCVLVDETNPDDTYVDIAGVTCNF